LNNLQKEEAMTFKILEYIERKGGSGGKPDYETFPIKDKNPLAGTVKTRMISAPNKPMLRITKMFYGIIRLRLKRKKIKFPYATAVLPGNNPLKNVLRHLKTVNRYFYLLDIKDFYPSTKSNQIVACLVDQALGLNLATSDELTRFLKEYCLSPSGALRIGAPASPDLANLVAAHLLDKEMAILCKKYSLTYTRYLDDLTFSAKRRFGKEKRQAIRKVIEQAGFEISHRKTVIADIKRESVVITGIGIKDGQIFIKRSFLRKINGLMHLIDKGKIQHQLSLVPSKKKRKDPVNIVRGLIAAFWSTIPPEGRKLNKLEEKTIRNFLEFSAKHRKKSKKPTRLEKKLTSMIQ